MLSKEVVTRSTANKRRRSSISETNSSLLTQKATTNGGSSESSTISKEIEKFIQNWQQFDKKSLQFQNEIRICTDELAKQHNLAQKLIDLNKQLQNMLKSSSDQKPHDLDLIFEAINGELQNLQTSTSTNASPHLSSAQIIENFFQNLNKFFSNFKEPVQIIEQINETRVKQEETIKKLRADNKHLKELTNDLSRKEKKQNGGDSELIRHLSAKVSKTLSMNSTLSTKLKVAQSEIESLKKLVITFRNGGGGGASALAIPSSVAVSSKKRSSKYLEEENTDMSLAEFLNHEETTEEDEEDDDDDDYEEDDEEEEEEEEGDDDDEDFLVKNVGSKSKAIETNANAETLQDDGDNEDENINYYSYFNSLTEANYGGEDVAAGQQQHQNGDSVGDFISKFYNRRTNTIFALPDYINTEDVVVKMREFMQKYKINQRDAGDRIIGVKKSHVSFLLSNLKTWEMLTRKGKEPYTRMFLFFYNIQEDGQDNVKKYFSQTYLLPKIDMSLFKSTPAKQQHSVAAAAAAESAAHDASSILLDSTNADIDLSELEHIIIPYDISSVSDGDVFDTFDLTERIKEVLKTNKASQELFCRAVLNLSDRIMCKPKPWNLLGKKAREHYIRMHLFLNDPFKFEKLNDWKEKHFNDKKWKPKKRRSTNVGVANGVVVVTSSDINATTLNANNSNSSEALMLDSSDTIMQNTVILTNVGSVDGDYKSDY